MANQRLTIKDIARLSGVGKSTVSRVLNNEDNVSQRTRERVAAVINQYGFMPLKSAQAMRAQSDKIIGIVLSRLDSPSENQAVRAILPLLYAQGFDVLIMESLLQPSLVADHLNILQQRYVEGVILFGFAGLDPQLLAAWQQKMVLMVHPYPGITTVRYDDAGAVAMLMDYLLAHNCQRISFIGVELSDETTGRLRYQAYLDACQRHAVAPVAALGDLSYHKGYSLAQQVIFEETQAVICASDTIALGVIKYLQQHPQPDVQVCSIGHTPLLTFLFPDILSVNPGFSEAGHTAATLLLTKLNGDTTSEVVTVPCMLEIEPVSE